MTAQTAGRRLNLSLANYTFVATVLQYSVVVFLCQSRSTCKATPYAIPTGDRMQPSARDNWGKGGVLHASSAALWKELYVWDDDDATLPQILRWVHQMVARYGGGNSL